MNRVPTCREPSAHNLDLSPDSRDSGGEPLCLQAPQEEVEALRTMQGLDLADPEVMAGAWRL